MPSQILNNADWIRTCEILYRGREFTGVPLAAAYNIIDNPIRPGFVAHIVNGEVRLADQDLDGGGFFGLFLSEYSAELDESDGKTIDPVLVQGPGTCYVWNEVLDNAGPAFALAAGETVHLVAVDGRLRVRAAEAGPSVGTLTKVLSDRIEIQLNAPEGVR